ncbi:hypothetical protein HHK36_020676 [Tetracentron sinense]|uniref:FAM86 N-terminal domain-containing protein n=1 Tax=Tetracentron sinense TaxID=13715 RepID=A0A835D8K9_TETSI|nr:hypothetical protein HHK36_020676 [Tetracentron sinense]
MADEELDLASPSCLHLLAAFLAMEPTECLISLAREYGGGSITKRVQRFIWEHCISKAAGQTNVPYNSYVKKFLKKVIVDVESNCDDVLDELYEQYANYMISLKDDSLVKGNTRVRKSISFLFPEGCFDVPSCPKSMKVVVPLQCSLNMLEGDTGCSIWPSSLFLSEFVLSYPEIFCSKSCFEVGSGVGLVGISLAHVKASKVILSDGDLSSLANMKLNLKLNQLSTEDMPERTIQDPTLIECKCLPWESASERDLQDIRPDIILGADVIYDPLCLLHLIRILALLLKPNKCNPHQRGNNWQGSSPKSSYINGGRDSYAEDSSCGFGTCRGRAAYNGASRAESLYEAMKAGRVAYIAAVIRNVDTFNYFLRLAGEAQLDVVDITGTQKPLNLLPYMQSYDRSSIRFFSHSSHD